MHILVVDDESDICDILQYNLEKEGYSVDIANSAEEAMKLNLQMYGLILLDVMMGEISGFQMAKWLKMNPATAMIPIIFITALEGEDNTVRGLNIGADDYISKPLSLKELKARVKAVLRRTGLDYKALYANNNEAKLIRFEQLVLNVDSKTAMLDGASLSLTKLEFELLSLFLHHQGIVFGRQTLLEHCWPEDVYVLDRTVDVNINRLRKKIGRYGKYIKTRVGYGYCFEK